MISRAAGYLADGCFPPALLQPFLNWYCTRYKVNMDEAEKSLESFTTFNEFFTRSLKKDARPINKAVKTAVSPTDGRVYNAGAIKNGLVMQVKDVYYSLSELIGKDYADRYDEGTQVTIYLSPGDYHRIHLPYEATPASYSYFPGTLWPVNDEFLNLVGGLFSLNERIFTEFRTAQDMNYGIVKVGALNVGRISLTYADTQSNRGVPEISNFSLPSLRKYARGEEIGRFSLGSTERLTVVGKSGCGKSTLLMAIGGFANDENNLHIAEGEILLGSKKVSKPDYERIIVFQEHSLLPWKSVLDNVMFPLIRARKVSKSEAEQRAMNYLQKVHLEDQRHKYPHQLSGGQRQRVSIARAFAMQSKILLMDEPYGALDALTKNKMQDELLELCGETKATVIFITHDIQEAIKVGHRVLVLSSHPGQVVAELNSVPPTASASERQALHDRIHKLLNH
ncbi:hypothetical protein CHS0354_026807 [Potamilus streckersoni]|uniref:phosphatidylserine decarboxylase n=1 Tax=Potamilus streckersoni TaxID=2493646 RepID=A0AAE0T5R9_9BIVA|nr:hypothetical protein CHS0354_026807 [Potamilus streckersoni]